MRHVPLHKSRFRAGVEKRNGSKRQYVPLLVTLLTMILGLLGLQLFPHVRNVGWLPILALLLGLLAFQQR